MTGWRLREFHNDHLDGILHLWAAQQPSAHEPVYGLSEVIASCQKDHAIVAVHGDDVIGAVVGRAAHDQGWVVFFAIDDDWRGQGIGSAMLAALEKQMSPHGLVKLSALIPENEHRIDAFTNQGFELKHQLRYFERRIPVQRQELSSLAELGGRLLPRGLWESVSGMRREKEILEQRLVLPLAQADLADRYGVMPPRAVVLFGPPGTGKTTFAKAIAARLEWSFVEVFPSRLAADPRGLAGALRETFTKIAELEHAVVFIDEVEEIAAQRSGEPPSPLQGVTNELLKIIPAFREQPGRLLVCATNFIRALDSAFLRHGRFDYVIPIGLPDEAARLSIWQRYVPEQVAGLVDVALLVKRSAGFSPADIEFAARSASQRAFEQAIARGAKAPDVSGEPAGPTTADYLEAIAGTRTTVSPETAAAFLEDIEALARV
ncbi:GNAT family N-acetyltransferase [Agromyces protaetiae]|uniref:GNAT family N-acetyltransferase n=1 Tax=Agromyces protaetiae TaxID=2509455 RepID=A0A4P6FG66_9MICO|nr:bifunctional GNAT family N-acetyltransferase/ATP-binding protein [Agromyces protaetiae]QAY72817.1 GNAT family N-acetyltransferase [Agromyces protaetiae]